MSRMETCPLCEGTGSLPIEQTEFGTRGSHGSPLNEIPHGTLSGYSGSTTRKGCRCARCKAAKRVYERQRRQAAL